MQVFAQFYDRIYAVLKDAVDVVAEFPLANMRPADDDSVLAEGPAVAWGWENASWDDRRGDGTGTWRITVGSPKSKAEAYRLIGLVNTALTAKLLSDSPTISVLVWRQIPKSIQELGKSPSGHWQVSMQFNVRLIAG